MLVRSQVIVGPSDVIDLNYDTVLSVLDTMGVEDKASMLIDIKHCYDIENELSGTNIGDGSEYLSDKCLPENTQKKV